MTLTDIYNGISGNTSNLIKSSFYITSDDNKKVIRISNHEAKGYNFCRENDEAEEILLIYVDCNITDIEAQNNIEEIKEYTGDIYIDYIIDNDIDYIVNMAKRFLN